jgi:hypothetical protein
MASWGWNATNVRLHIVIFNTSKQGQGDAVHFDISSTTHFTFQFQNNTRTAEFNPLAPEFSFKF